jgi:hypothetical protein
MFKVTAIFAPFGHDQSRGYRLLFFTGFLVTTSHLTHFTRRSSILKMLGWRQ